MPSYDTELHGIPNYDTVSLNYNSNKIKINKVSA